MIFGFLSWYPKFRINDISAYLVQSTKSQIEYFVSTPNKFSALPNFNLRHDLSNSKPPKIFKIGISKIQSEIMKCYFDSPKAITGDFQLYIACANLDHFESSEIVGFRAFIESLELP